MKKDTMNQRRVRVALGSSLSPAHPGSLNAPPAAERIGVPSPGVPCPSPKPALGCSCRFCLPQMLAGATLEQHQHHPHGQSLGGGVSAPPTCLVCRDIGDCSSPGLQAEVRDTIDGLHPKGVVGVGQEVGHRQRSLHQAHLLGHEADPTAARLALASVPHAAPADHVVHDVSASPLVQGRAPLQCHRGAIYTGDQVHRSRGGAWKRSRGTGRAGAAEVCWDWQSMGPMETCTLGSVYPHVQMMLQGIQSCPERGMLQTKDSEDTDRSQDEMPWG